MLPCMLGAARETRQYAGHGLTLAEGQKEKLPMSPPDRLLSEVALANRILAREGVVDAYGHASARHPDDPARFLLSRR